MSSKTLLAAIAMAATATGAMAQAGESAAQPGDPQRWSVPAATPSQKYAVAIQDAGAALNEALKECRATSAGRDRKSCETRALQQWTRDRKKARDDFPNDSNTTR